MSVQLKDIDSALMDWAPAGTAQSYDNVGLQIGRLSKNVARCLIALDLTPDVVREAINSDVDCVITHHPLIFKPLSDLTDGSLVSSMALDLAEAKIALYAIHTNLDAAHGGVSFELAKSLGLENIEFLSGLENSVVKLVLFVPIDHIDAVRDAAFGAGAGQIGNYSECSFSHGGSGTFRPGDSSEPFSGSAGGPRESVNEVKLEMQVSSWQLNAVLDAVQEVHPYEEVAHDIIPIENEFKGAGIGAVGTLAAPTTLASFLDSVSIALNNPGLRYVGDEGLKVGKVAVCGGSGSDFIGLAGKAGADVYVTADVTYHRFFEVMNQDGQIDMALIDAGHYETESMTESLLCNWLSERFPDVEWIRTSVKTSPVKTWTGK